MRIGILFAFFVCIATAVRAEQVPFFGAPPYTLPKRIALVIGVENYSGGGALQLGNLPGAGRDARSMADVLEATGFEVTRLIADPANPASKWVTQDQINDAITDLIISAQNARARTGRGAIVAFYFAGHGVTVRDKNYLLPSQFSATFLENIPAKAIELEAQVINAFGAADIAPELKIIIVDACRNSAPASIPSLAGVDTGWVRRGIVNPTFDGAGFDLGKNHTIVLYATLPGNQAFGGDIGGQFTNRFVGSLKAQMSSNPAGSRHKSLQEIFRQVWTFMMAQNNKKQIPNMDEKYASTFYPFPTEADFKQEQSAYLFVKNIPTAAFANAGEINDFQTCEFTKMLDAFSQYSYFSAEIIRELNSRGGAARECDVADSRLRRGSDDRWQPTEPNTSHPKVPTAPPLNRGEVSSGGPFFGRSTDLSAVRALSWRIGRAERVTRAVQVQVADEREKSRDAQRLAPITFADLKELLSSLPSEVTPSRLPDDAVPLNRSVVTKGKSNLRTKPGAGQELVTTVAPGEFLEVVRATPGRTWLEVRHSTAGQGFISGDLVEPALVNINKMVAFEPDAFEPTKEVLVDLTAAFGSLGGVAIVDGSVAYSQRDSRIGFARAAAVRSFVQSLLVPPEKSPSRVYVRLREDLKSDIPSGKVLVTLQGLPLNRSVRAAIARTVGNNSSILLDLDSTRSIPDSELPADAQSSAPIANICARGSQCIAVPNVIRPTELKEGLGEVTNVQPPMKQSPLGVDGMRTKLKLLRF